jgi:hypothetical protein
MIMCMDGVGIERKGSVDQLKGGLEVSCCKCQCDSGMGQSGCILTLKDLDGTRVPQRSLTMIVR